MRISPAGFVLGLFVLSLSLFSQEPPATEKEDPNKVLRGMFKWLDGPGTAELGSHARIELPMGFSFIGGDDTRKLMRVYDNSISNKELGTVVQTAKPGEWFVVFEFDDIGYVKDAASEKLDASAILNSFKEGSKARNEERVKRGGAPLNVVGWKTAPNYNPETQNLEWCLHLESGGQPVLNHNIRILGRRGVMEVTLVCTPEELDAALSQVRSVLAQFSYKEGEKYAQWSSGDKVAQYGLTALVVGGGVALAAKSGLLGKLIKPILLGVLVIGGAIASVFKKIFGIKAEKQA